MYKNTLNLYLTNFNLNIKIFNIFNMCMCVWICAYECRYPRDQVTMELELQEVVSG